MNTKSTAWMLAVAAIASVALAGYQFYSSRALKAETIEWKTKYEEALIDMEEANKRIELMKEDLEKALAESEKHRIIAESTLLELQKQKPKR